MKNILVINALNGVFPLVLKKKYPSAKITCAEVFPFYKSHLRGLGFEVVDWETMGNMKFDLVIGNPPYQNVNKSSDKLWIKFVKQAMEMTNDGGHLAFVTPNGWFHKPEGQKFTLLSSMFSDNNLVEVNLDASKFFPGIGESIGWWILQVGVTGNNTKLISEGQLYDIKWTGEKIPLTPEEIVKNKIISKMTNGRKRLSLYHDYKHDVNTTDLLSRSIISTTKDRTHNTPIFWSASQTMWGKSKDIRQGWKVIINKSGHYYSTKNPDKYITYSDVIGVGQLAFGVTCSTEQECLNLMSYLTSKLYIWFMTVTKTNGWNDAVRLLPYLDTSREWTDQSIYSFFELTAEEITYIERCAP